MQELNDLIQKLEAPEKKLVKTYLDNLVLRSKKDMKITLLFDFLLKNNKALPGAEECAAFLYKSKPDSRFRMLKSKLKSRILDALLTDQNIERNNLLDAADLSAIKARKRLSQYYLLILTRGHSSFSNSMLEEIIRSGLKYENYVAVTEAMKAKKYQKGFSKGLADFQKINLQIAFYEYCDQAKMKARDFYYKFILRTDFNAGYSAGNHRKYLEACIAELSSDFKRTRSALVGYYLKLIAFAHYNAMGDHLTARQSCEELLDITRKNASVYKKQRVGIAFDYLAECDVNLGAYKEALLHLQEAQRSFPLRSNNFLVSKETELKTLFYMDDMKGAGRALNELVENSALTNTGDFRFSKYQFYSANILFSQAKYKEALKDLSQHLDISKDKSGWEVAVRVLAIMCDVELQRFDEASLLVENLRKHAQRNKEISKRNLGIISVLQVLARRGFLFSDLDKKTIKLLEDLAGKDRKYRWQPLGTELIPFHAWMSSKVKTRQLQTAV
jgi:hypothetical protein